MLFGLDALPLTSPKTGVGHYTAELARALARCAPSDEFELAYPSTFPALAGGEGESNKLPENLKVARVAVGALGRRWWSVGLPLHARRRGYDLFHGTNYDVPVWGGCATVLTVHDLSTRLHPETHEARRVFRSRWRLPLMARAATVIITPTESVRRELCQHMTVEPSKVFAVAEAPRRVFAPADETEAREVRRRLGVEGDFLLAVGTVEPRKNLLALVLAFEELVRRRGENLRLRLVIAGPRGWLNREFLARAEHWVVKDRITFTGYVSDEDLRALYTSCRAFVYPSLYEGFGLPPLEAMACGAPVVASRIPALAETAGGAALLVPPSDVRALAEAVEGVLDDAALAARLARAGLAHAAKFTWERAARQTLEVYREALRRNSAGPRRAGGDAGAGGELT
ncbi:MAG TPA: glycosyltransferase family 1 protein [Pyrinomonadaceae bacterium]|nr:glycosyltransferase family 1 protein [Pyrinomonadaceae bacterium]